MSENTELFLWWLGVLFALDVFRSRGRQGSHRDPPSDTQWVAHVKIGLGV